MTFNKTLLTATMLTLGGFAAMSSANAATNPATSTFNVTMKVESSCTVTTAPTISLSTIDAGGIAPAVGTSSFNVACSKDTPFTISMLPSATDSDGVGSMKGTLLNEDTIAYTLTTDADGNTPWTGLARKTGVGTGTATNIPFDVYAKVTTDDFKTVKPDTYTETVTVSVAY